ncbi:MAG: sulfotransferase [Deltaproteobacteria bacterium]|nr:sulfotransferase [Deltaproteobacteria bacterium]
MKRDRETPAPVFVVGTGRCGSTLLSSMVRLHPRVLSLSEFFSYLGPGGVRAPRVSGKTAFRRLNTPTRALRMFLESGVSIDEFVYPLDAGGRYSRGNVPPIMYTTLPHLTDRYHELWDELGPLVRSRGRHRLTDHYRFVFEWLKTRFDRAVWVERSGGTLPMAPVLARHFPDARLVHIFRDGRDTALSMYRHPGFRGMAISSLMLRKIGLDPFSPVNWRGSSPWVHVVAAIQLRFVSPKRFLEADLDLASFGWVWSGMVESGTAFLATLPSDRVLSMRFESLLESPREEMSRFIDFVGPELADGRWLEEVSALPRRKSPAWSRLAPEERARLAEACAPGQKILGYNNSV